MTNDPSTGKYNSLSFLPATLSVSDPGGLLELTRHPTRALNIVLYVASGTYITLIDRRAYGWLLKKIYESDSREKLGHLKKQTLIVLLFDPKDSDPPEW